MSDYVENRKRIADALASAIEASGCLHVVLLSSIGAHRAEGTGPILALHYAEEKLRRATTSLTVLRAPYFMENWISLLGTARAKGILPSFLSPRRKIPMVATRDIGCFAAESLLDPAKGHRVLELSGPADYSPEDVAAAVGQRLGHDVRVQYLPLSAVIPTFMSMGFSHDAARLFEELYAGMEQGRIGLEGNGAAHARGLVTLSEAMAGFLLPEPIGASLQAAS